MDGPIFLSEVITVPPGARVSVVSSRIQNPFRAPMLVDEIRYRVISSSSEFGMLQGFWALRARHFLGRVPLTQDFVPIGSLAKSLGPTEDTGFPFPPALPTLGWYTWKLPKPLYVPATELLTTEIFNAAVSNSIFPDETFEIQVSYAARTLPVDTPPPAKVYVPWACFFEAPSFSEDGFDIVSSTEAHINNPFNEELYVQRFIGRAIFNWGPPAPGLPVGAAEFNSLFAWTTSRFTTVRASDSFGRILARDPIPWTQMFYFPTRSWTVNTKLQPKGFYLFELTRDYTGIEPPPNSFLISMIGHREVVYQP